MSSDSSSSEFIVNKFTRVNDDVCSYNHEYRESVGPGRYLTTNLVPDRSKVLPQALANPTITAASSAVVVTLPAVVRTFTAAKPKMADVELLPGCDVRQDLRVS
jgi:hypothetical protein